MRNRRLRDPSKVSEREWKKVDKADAEYFRAIRSFYNKLVPAEKRIAPGTHILRITRSQPYEPLFSLEVAAQETLFTFVGEKHPYQMNRFFPMLIYSPKLKEIYGKMIKSFADPEISRIYPELTDNLFAIVEEIPSEEFLDCDEFEFDLTAIPTTTKEERRKMYNIILDLKSETVKIKVVNQVNHPDAYRDYLKLKSIMRRIDNFGIAGL